MTGTIQFWPVALVAPGGTIPLTLLGPVAVAAAARSLGLGRRLIAASLAIADRDGLDPIVLIGDHSYYGPFGFTAEATGGWTLPGPVERERLLLRQRIARPLPHVGHLVAADSVAGAFPAMAAADG